MYRFLLTIAFIFLKACSSSVHQYNAGDVRSPLPAKSIKKISAESEQFTILGFVFDTNYVTEAVDKLNEQCPDAWIQGIIIRYSTAHGFMSWKNRVYLEGYCTDLK